MSLTAEQRAAVEHLHTPVMVLAGAGTGKTTMLTAKVDYLIRQCGIKPNRICAFTFTNKAAHEMLSRLQRRLTKEQMRGLCISTFHAFGLKIVRRFHQALGFKAQISLWDQQDALILLGELCCEQGDANKTLLQGHLHAISRWKSACINPEQAAHLAQDDLGQQRAHLYASYQRYLQNYNAIDFDDLINLPLHLLQHHPEIAQILQNEVHYLLVDEYQDTNPSQYALIKGLVGPRAAFTVVGDDYQSIYAWRGACPQHLQELQKDFPTLQILALQKNYRSTGNILRAAGALIQHNKLVFTKSLWSELGAGDPIRVLTARDDTHEASRVVSYILKHHLEYHAPFHDYAILYRSNHQSRVFEKALREQRIPYRLSGGTSLFARTEIKDILSYCRLLVNPDDDSAFLRIANVPKREIGPKTLDKLSVYAKARQTSLFTASLEFGLEQTLNGKGLSDLRAFITLLQHWQRELERQGPLASIRGLMQDIAYEDWLLSTSSSPKQAERRKENLQDLLSWLERLLGDDEQQDLSQALHKMMLYDMLDQKTQEEASNCVQLSTLHAAKGLEFSHVIIIGMEEELLPHRNNLDEDAIEEERRLCYVGITRAKRNLVLSLARQRKQFQETRETTPSRFLGELPAELLVWDEADSDTVRTQDEGRSHLRAIRKALQACGPSTDE